MAFFLLAMFAAWTSSISLAETVVSVFKDRWGWRRLIAYGACFGLIPVLGLLSCLGYDPLSGIEPLGAAFLNFFNFITNLLIMPIAALAACHSELRGQNQVHIGRVKTDGNEFRMKTAYSYSVRYVCPICMTLVLITGLLAYFGIYSI